MDALGGLAGLIFTAQEGAPFFGIPFAGEQTTLRRGLKEDGCLFIASLLYLLSSLAISLLSPVKTEKYNYVDQKNL